MKDILLTLIILLIAPLVVVAEAHADTPRSDPLVKERYLEHITFCTYLNPQLGEYDLIIDAGKQCPPTYYRKI